MQTQNQRPYRRHWASMLWALAGSLLIGGFGVAAPSAGATSTTMVELGQAASYAVLSGASVGNTADTTLRGDLGVSVNAAPTGFPPGVVTGTIRVGNVAAAAAHADLVAAYNDVAGRAPGTAIAGDVIGRNSRRACTPTPPPCRTPER